MGRKYSLFNFLEKRLDIAGADTVTLQSIEKASFLRLALHIAISYIANTLSKCEIKTYEGGKEVKGQLYYLLNVSPNPNQNASQFINQIVENYFYNHGALVVMHNDHFYCADSFDIDDENPLKEYTFRNVTFNSYEAKKKYRASEVCHFRLDNDNVKGLIDTLYTQYGDIMSSAIKAFKKANGKKYKLMLESQYRAGDPGFAKLWEETLKNQVKTFVESDDAVYPQFKGVDLQDISNGNSSNLSGDIIAIRKEIFDTTAQALKIPLPMMYGNITNINEIVKVYLTFCIDPLADMLSEELTRKKYDYNGWRNGNYIEVDTSCINYVDILEIADKADKAIASGVCNIDDVRKRVRLNALNTDFSTSHFITKNYELAENALKSIDEKGGEVDE